jgi:Ca2+-binding RTX toxin-like protein
MSSSFYKFTIQGSAVTQVQELDDGYWKTERIGSNKTWAYDVSTAIVTKTETEHGYTKIRTFTDLDGDGIYNKVSSSSSSSSSSGVTSTANNFASSLKLYDFTIDGNNDVTAVFENEHGAWQNEGMSWNETWAFDPTTNIITKTENEHGRLETTTYIPDGNGYYTRDSQTYQIGSGSTTLIDDSYNDDILYGYESADRINSGDGDDYIESYAGNDNLNGGNGNDFLYAGAGNDSVDGGAGDDLIFGSDGAGNDSYRGGQGIDTIEYSNLASSINVNLSRGISTGAAINTDRLYDIENIIAGDSDDSLIGSSRANYIYGELGDDNIDASTGNDFVYGGDGDDNLNGGLGQDTLTGGDGADDFIFNTKLSASNADIILDFDDSVDTIQLDDAIFKKLKNDADLSDNIVVGTRAIDRNDYLIYNDITDVLYYDADGSGTGAQVAISVVTIGSVDASDFVVI